MRYYHIDTKNITAQITKIYDNKIISELAEQIKITGCLVRPLIVRENGYSFEKEDLDYTLVSGELEYLAVVEAGLETVGCMTIMKNGYDHSDGRDADMDDHDKEAAIAQQLRILTGELSESLPHTEKLVELKQRLDQEYKEVITQYPLLEPAEMEAEVETETVEPETIPVEVISEEVEKVEKVVETVESLKKQYTTLKAAKAATGLKAVSWQKLADKINQSRAVLEATVSEATPSTESAPKSVVESVISELKVEYKQLWRAKEATGIKAKSWKQFAELWTAKKEAEAAA